MPETERMILRRTNWPDVDDVAAMNAARRGGRPTGDPSATVAHVLSEEMPRLMAHNRRDDQLGSWVARDRSTGSFLGWFTVRPIDSPVHTVELSYRLVDRTRGGGYDVEGALQMIALARNAQVHTVVAASLPDDDEFDRVMEQAGLRRVVPTDAALCAELDTDPQTSTSGVYSLDLSAVSV